MNSSTKENVIMQSQCKREISISVLLNASKTEGIRVFSHKRYIRMLELETSFLAMSFSH